ncbi:MAG: hypothetical protein WA945_04140 [Arcobacteraceae bacterium]
MPKKKKNKSNFFTIFIAIVIIAGLSYFGITKAPNSETYKIRAAGSEDGYKASFINVTGKNAEDKKIELSDDYWTDGKFK